jgi:hypothetical protein
LTVWALDMSWAQAADIHLPGAVAEHKRAQMVDRQRSLAPVVTEGHCHLGRPQEHVVLNAIPQSSCA